MIIWLARILILLAGPTIAYFQVSKTLNAALIGFTLSLIIIIVELVIQSIPLDTLIIGILGIVLGLIIAKLLDYTIYLTENQKLYEIVRDFNLVIKIIFAYLGLVIAVHKKSELDLLDRDIFKKGARKRSTDVIILDTSAVIDGRIADIAETKFISAVLVLPRFVLEELQKLADSSDNHKRMRARRGLDIIAQLQKMEEVTVKIFDKDYPEIKEVDKKLLLLGKDLQAKIVTTDFNLNKIATLQGVTVLNINDLSNSLKPVYLPGETMMIFPVKEGKEQKQAVGYLDDGTMVVIEDGRRYIGKRIEVTVSSILQTSSGRMVFTHPASESNKDYSNGSPR
ncbi:MAG: PIN domain nuclease [Elusimicrobia bacterium]|nr:PIN domain nuclease [Elusimicrobiota bacterium]